MGSKGCCGCSSLSTAQTKEYINMRVNVFTDKEDLRLLNLSQGLFTDLGIKSRLLLAKFAVKFQGNASMIYD
jgi:hypothetical protein